MLTLPLPIGYSFCFALTPNFAWFCLTALCLYCLTSLLPWGGGVGMSEHSPLPATPCIGCANSAADHSVPMDTWTVASLFALHTMLSFSLRPDQTQILAASDISATPPWPPLCGYLPSSVCSQARACSHPKCFLAPSPTCGHQTLSLMVPLCPSQHGSGPTFSSGIKLPPCAGPQAEDGEASQPGAWDLHTSFLSVPSGHGVSQRWVSRSLPVLP